MKPHEKAVAVLAGAAAAVLLLAGCGNNAALNQAKHAASAERATITALRSQVSDLRTQLTSAQQAASQAEATAKADAKAAYAARNAALNRKAASLRRRARALAAAEGRLQSSRINADGVYVVGSDIQPGTWHTSGDGGSGDQCYYAILGSTNTGDIIDNNNFDGPETVSTSGAAAFEISGPCEWVRVG
jgi:outer membrane murein-binding lipoprotein Lpp